MAQELRITPQLQQAIKLLQLSRQELMDRIQEEMVENPLLEEAVEVPVVERRPDSEEKTPKLEPLDTQSETSVDAVSPTEAVDDIDWASYLENYSSPLPGGSSQGFEEFPSFENTLSSQTGLSEHLLWQLGMIEASDEELHMAEIIIQGLDEVGYLRDDTLEAIVTREEVSMELAEDALTLVQDLDPIGVGARDLAECLLLQARHLYPKNALLHQVVAHHLPDLERRQYAGIARTLGKTKDEILDTHRLIQTLDPRPGQQYTQSQPQYITPDIYIMRQGDAWVPILNEDGLPRLRVSEQYQRVMRTKGAADSKDAETRSYVQEKLRGAAWLIRSIHQRQQTILKVTESIIRFQQDFFDNGIEHLRPLVLREVADDIEMHESTISRVTTNKYVHTTRGIFELKFFFNSSIRKTAGPDVAAESVKYKIKEIIAGEPPAKPLSDQRIVVILANEHGIEIARRTVAKYREALGILSSSRRKRLI